MRKHVFPSFLLHPHRFANLVHPCFFLILFPLHHERTCVLKTVHELHRLRIFDSAVSAAVYTLIVETCRVYVCKSEAQVALRAGQIDRNI